jgi:hypothetical protein
VNDGYRVPVHHRESVTLWVVLYMILIVIAHLRTSFTDARDLISTLFIIEEYVSMLRGQGKSEPLEILDSWRGRKCLVFEVSSVRLISGTMQCLREISKA